MTDGTHLPLGGPGARNSGNSDDQQMRLQFYLSIASQNHSNKTARRAGMDAAIAQLT
ncbi:hypothetical protein [Nocardia sp. NPDC051832]|uniref:hypothetical protein n=1 Tax=Nocardia sp. NPDC051832 TaxID=3155673 RepID=UPI003435540E